MLREYYLYLDESGDFDKDLLSGWKNECLVGGILVKDKSLSEETAKKVVLHCWRELFPDEIKLPEEMKLKRIRHATELEESVKARIKCDILNEAEQIGEFIIFQNYKKTKILNSTITYVNIMSDGIVQLLGRLAMENPKDKIRLHVIAGFRKDTTRKVTSDNTSGYIEDKECINRIKEKIALLRIKNPNILSHQSEVTFEYKDDKRFLPLILSDYICNVYYTNGAKVFREIYKDGVSYQEHLMKKYLEKNIFSLNGNSERDRLMSYLNMQDYGTAIYEVCVGLIEQQENKDSLLQAFIQLPEAVQKNHLRSFDNYINNLIATERKIDDEMLAILNRALELLEKINEVDTVDLVAPIFSILLYKLAVHNHRGELQEMKVLFERCQELLGKLSQNLDYLDYLFLFYNRYAEYRIDNFDIQGAFEMLEQVKGAFEGLELALDSLPCQNMEKEKVASDQLGKILGTQVQCCRYLMSIGKIEYQDAVQVSDRAIENFSAEQDKCRQYQYRAQIEAEAGNYEQAFFYLKKGFGVKNAKEFFDNDKKKAFGLYHLSMLVEKFADDEEHTKEIDELLKLYASDRKNIERKGYPYFLTLGNIAEALVKRGKVASQIQAFYESSFLLEGKREALFEVLKLCMKSSYLGWMKKTGAAGIEGLEKEMKNSCIYLLADEERLSEGLRNMIVQIQEILQNGAHEEELLEYSKLRQY